jgi:hypothetical protein
MAPTSVTSMMQHSNRRTSGAPSANRRGLTNPRRNVKRADRSYSMHAVSTVHSADQTISNR